jgi:hypothetical protein
MLVHLVLFTPRPDLSPTERDAFARALATALDTIPTIRRYQLGHRIRHGAAYETLMPVNFEYAGILEFDDEAGLRAYLAHPAHEELGRLFYSCSEAALAHDYEMAEGNPELAVRRWSGLAR